MEKAELEALLLEVRERLLKIEERLRPEPRCYNVKQAAEVLGVSLTVMKEMMARGEVKPSTVGRRKMIAVSELERVSTPDAERPQVEKRQRQARWEPISKKRR